MSKKYLVLFLLLPTSFGFGFRFICNGILASGEEHTDSCGVCDTKHAARWAEPNIAVAVDFSVLPKNLSKDDWQMVVQQSFSAWNDVSGSDLTFEQIETKNAREFGANNTLHEVFWITDKEEWRKLVGSGEFGTLGATVPRYYCGADGELYREIFDADLVLNGLSHISWQLDCQSEDCISPQTTLVHELGHFFGLDHPCLQCSDSIMSARAGFDLVHPLFDDMQGLRTLYPDGTTGGFASHCKNDSDCDQDLICIKENKTRYCSKICQKDDQCRFGSSCSERGGKKFCLLNEEESEIARKEGENCTKIPCADPLVCAGASEPYFYCFAPCKEKKDCRSGQTCLPVSDIFEDTSICVSLKSAGHACNHKELCEEDLFCIFDKLYEGTCRRGCGNKGSIDRCGPDEVCHDFKQRVEVCMPADHELVLEDSISNIDEDLKLDESFLDFVASSSDKDSKHQMPKEAKVFLMGCVSKQPINGVSFLMILFIIILKSLTLFRNSRNFKG